MYGKAENMENKREDPGIYVRLETIRKKDGRAENMENKREDPGIYVRLETIGKKRWKSREHGK